MTPMDALLRFQRQLRMMLYKNFLQKRVAWASTAAEVALPVAFMLLLVLIKQITTQYDAPNVDYACGQTLYQYAGDLVEYADPVSGPASCAVAPSTCAAGNYYRSGGRIGFVDLPDVGLATYAFTVADNTSAYAELRDAGLVFAANPSLSFGELMSRMQTVDGHLAVAPRTGDPTTAAGAAAFFAAMEEQLNAVRSPYNESGS